MAIFVKLDDVPTTGEPTELAGVGITRQLIHPTGKARGIRFGTLEAICDALNCQPGDLLQNRREEPEYRTKTQCGDDQGEFECASRFQDFYWY
jgi:putative transcriptional regulator